MPVSLPPGVSHTGGIISCSLSLCQNDLDALYECVYFLDVGESPLKSKKQLTKEAQTQILANLPLVVSLTEKDMSAVNGGGQINAI